MRVLVIGAGAVGARAVRQLVESPEVTEVAVFDTDPTRQGSIIDSSGRKAVAGSPDAPADAVLLAGPCGTHVGPARQHLAAGRVVVSTSDAIDDVEALLGLDAEARASGVAVVAGAAFSPGYSCVLARHAATSFTTVTEVHVARMGTGGPACARQRHSALAGQALDWRDGDWHRRPAGSGRELCWFPDPIGAQDCYRAELPDAVLLQPTFPGVERVTARLSATRRDRLSAHLPMLRKPHPEGLVGAIRAEVRGERRHGGDALVYGALDRPAVAAGATAALAVRWAVNGRLPVGAGGLGRVDDPVAFLSELVTVGIKAAVFEGSGQTGHQLDRSVYIRGMEPSRSLTLDQINLSDFEFWTRPYPDREGAFLTLREQDPIRFFDEPEYQSDLVPPGPGYYALTRHADVLEASKHPQIFCSGRGTNIGDMPEDFLEFLGSMINMDDPKHARLRRIVSRGFTPRQLDQMKGDVEATAAGIVDDIIERGEGDFVTDIAATLPLRIIVDMMGIPRSQEKFIFDCTNVILGLGDPEYVPDQTEGGVMMALMTVARDLSMLITELGEARVKDPKDDVTTVLVTAEVEGEMLSPQELASFFILLVVAGNETTRNAISHGMLALTEHPEQMAAWQADFDAMAPAAVEEIVRWATPVIHFRRTVTQDGARIGDQTFNEGDKVVLWYCSANRDDVVFDDPFRFDLRRTPNDHLGFGGPGPHFCLGAHLARREITVMFQEVFKRMPDIRAVGAPDRLQSNFINGIKHLPLEWTPASAT